jgi:alginate O-acetyltransferase complex protein AlgI
VLWGLYHGLFLVIERVGLGRWLLRLWRPVRHAYVLLTAMVGWVLFRAADLGQAGEFLRAMAGFSTATVSGSESPAFVSADVVAALVVGAVLSWPLLSGLRTGRARVRCLVGAGLRRPWDVLSGAVKTTVLMTVLVLSCAWLASGAYNPFIYFRF